MFSSFSGFSRECTVGILSPDIVRVVLCSAVVFQLVFQKLKIELSQASTVESRVIRNVDWAEEGALDRLVMFARVSLGLGGFSFVIA